MDLILNYIIWFLIFLLSLYFVYNKFSRRFFIKKWLNNFESHLALAITEYLKGNWYTETQAIEISISSVKTINRLHIKNYDNQKDNNIFLAKKHE